MKLKEIETLALLPSFMRDDPFNAALAAAIDWYIKSEMPGVDALSVFDKIDELSEWELDMLAKELNVTWYDFSASADIKKEVIKTAGRVHRMLATPEAIEMVISIFFGSGEVKEWFEYEGGQPGYFRVYSSNPSVTNENLKQFLRILEKVKRKSIHLDGIHIMLDCKTDLYLGFAYHEVKRQTVKFGKGGR